jgi:tetratricopeptide (TPR) repeat protein
MKRTIGVILILLFCTYGASVCAFDWKNVHEEADTLTVEDAQREVQAAPESAKALYLLGLTCLSAHRDADAHTVFTGILRGNANSYEALWGTAEALRRQHKIEESEKLLRRVIAQDTHFAPAMISLAYIKYIQADFKASVELAGRVIREGALKVDRSNYTRAYLLAAGGKGMLAYYGGLVSKMANGRAIMPNLRKAEQLQPDSPAVHFGLGSYYFLAPALLGGNRKKALEYLEKAVAGDPLFADAYVRLAQAYKAGGDEQKYRLNLNKAKEIDPQNPLLLDMESGRCKFICPSTER